MDERHENEQYFFDAPTLERLTDFLSGWENACCLCAPMLGRHLAPRGVGPGHGSDCRGILRQPRRGKVSDPSGSDTVAPAAVIALVSGPGGV
jgi:hypothetical protein